MKHFLAIGSGIFTGMWLGNQAAAAMNMPVTGSLDGGDLIQVAVAVVMVYISLWLASMI